MDQSNVNDTNSDKKESKFVFPIEILNEITDNEKKRLLKLFIDLMFDDHVNPAQIDHPEVKHAFMELLTSSDAAAVNFEKRFEAIKSSAAKENRAKRREKDSVSNRLRAIGLHSVKPNLTNKKLIIP